MTKDKFWLLLITITSLAIASCSLEAPTCTPGEIECHGAVYSECIRSGAAWDEIICNAVDNTKPFCHVEQICVQCNDDSDCQSLEKHCVDHACEPLSVAACVDGAKTCKNSKIYTCSKKAWETPFICPDGCNDENTACRKAGEVCTDDAKRCTSDNKGFEVCSKGIWRLVLCMDDNFCNPQTLECNPMTTNCTNDDKRCSEHGKTVELCKTGTWETLSSCLDDSICNPETYQCEFLTVTCKEKFERCSDDFRAIETCINSAWVSEICTNSNICNLETLQCEKPPGRCKENSKRCSLNSSSVETCRNNAWEEELNCHSEAPCNPDTLQCESYLTTCNDGTTRCVLNTNVVELCNDGVWTSVLCKRATPVCDAGQCVECLNNVIRCKPYDDSIIEICNANRWEIKTFCLDNQSCDPLTRQCSGPTETCTNDTKRCNGNNIERCHFGLWMLGEKCQEPTGACYDGKCAPFKE